MNNLLEITNYSEPIDGFLEKVVFGGEMVLIGMTVIFAVLALLWACLYLFKLFFHDIPSRKTKISASVPTVSVAPAKPVHETANADEEIIAVIAAAIAAAESENAGLKFRVVSFRRK